jgi:hypothetical protein
MDMLRAVLYLLQKTLGELQQLRPTGCFHPLLQCGCPLQAGSWHVNKVRQGPAHTSTIITFLSRHFPKSFTGSCASWSGSRAGMLWLAGYDAQAIRCCRGKRAQRMHTSSTWAYHMIKQGAPVAATVRKHGSLLEIRGTPTATTSWLKAY